MRFHISTRSYASMLPCVTLKAILSLLTQITSEFIKMFIGDQRRIQKSGKRLRWNVL